MSEEQVVESMTGLAPIMPPIAHLSPFQAYPFYSDAYGCNELNLQFDDL